MKSHIFFSLTLSLSLSLSNCWIQISTSRNSKKQFITNHRQHNPIKLCNVCRLFFGLDFVVVVVVVDYITEYNRPIKTNKQTNKHYYDDSNTFFYCCYYFLVVLLHIRFWKIPEISFTFSFSFTDFKHCSINNNNNNKSFVFCCCVIGNFKLFFIPFPFGNNEERQLTITWQNLMILTPKQTKQQTDRTWHRLVNNINDELYGKKWLKIKFFFFVSPS